MVRDEGEKFLWITYTTSGSKELNDVISGLAWPLMAAIIIPLLSAREEHLQLHNSRR